MALEEGTACSLVALALIGSCVLPPYEKGFYTPQRNDGGASGPAGQDQTSSPLPSEERLDLPPGGSSDASGVRADSD